MSSTLLVSFYVPLFLSAVLIKKIIVQRKIGKSPLIFAQKVSWTEALMKRSVFLFFPIWLGGLLVHSFFLMKGRPLPVLFESQFLSSLGVILLYLSWIFFVICLIQMRDAWRFGIDQKQ